MHPIDWLIVVVYFVWIVSDGLRRTKDADKVEEVNRYNAACAAARAAAGEGRVTKPLDEAGKAELRKKAVKWLAADVSGWKGLLDATMGVPPDHMIEVLAWAKQDGDLACIRDAEFVSKLPADEQKSVNALWTDLDALLAKARAGQPAK